MPLRPTLQLAAPFFLAQRSLHRKVGALAADLPGRLLDVGCGTKPYRSLFPNTEYYGVEVPIQATHGSKKLADVYFDGKHLPFADNSFDAILCNQVLEHVFSPTEFLSELNRVLRPGGKLLLTVPFIWDEHEQPYDFARYSSFGVAHLARMHGFSVLRSMKTLDNAGILAQLTLTYLYKVLRRFPAPIGKIMTAAASLPLNVVGLLLSSISPRNPDLYLDNVVLWLKPDASIQDES